MTSLPLVVIQLFAQSQAWYKSCQLLPTRLVGSHAISSLLPTHRRKIPPVAPQYVLKMPLLNVWGMQVANTGQHRHMPAQMPAYRPTGPSANRSAGCSQRSTQPDRPKRRRICSRAVIDGPGDSDPDSSIDQLALRLTQEASKLRQSMADSGESLDLEASVDGGAQPADPAPTPVRPCL